MIIFSDAMLIELLCVAIILFLLECYLYFLLPKIRYKALAKMKDAENEYIFCDNVLKTFTKSQEYNGEAEIEYSLFVKVYETTKYLFLYQTNNQVFIVDKNTVEGGTIEEIRNELKNKYKMIMIDEYQDTSSLQENFISLIENQNVYMVGDIKQSIYAFRNAESSIFKGKYDSYRKEENPNEVIDMKNNFCILFLVFKILFYTIRIRRNFINPFIFNTLSFLFN